MEDSTFKPIVITSKAATKDLQNIETQHKEILLGMQNQSMKNQAMTQQKQLDQKDKAVQDADVNKTNQENTLKNRELDIKEKALTII